MEWFGLTIYGHPDPFKDMMKEDYKEPVDESTVKILDTSKTTFAELISELDVYIGHCNGYAYGSVDRLKRSRSKGIPKPAGPTQMYKYHPTTQMESGWFLSDPALKGHTWFHDPYRRPFPKTDISKYYEEAVKKDPTFRF